MEQTYCFICIRLLFHVLGNPGVNSLPLYDVSIILVYVILGGESTECKVFSRVQRWDLQDIKEYPDSPAQFSVRYCQGTFRLT